MRKNRDKSLYHDKRSQSACRNSSAQMSIYHNSHDEMASSCCIKALWCRWMESNHKGFALHVVWPPSLAKQNFFAARILVMSNVLPASVGKNLNSFFSKLLWKIMDQCSCVSLFFLTSYWDMEAMLDTHLFLKKMLRTWSLLKVHIGRRSNLLESWYQLRILRLFIDVWQQLCRSCTTKKPHSSKCLI